MFRQDGIEVTTSKDEYPVEALGVGAQSSKPSSLPDELHSRHRHAGHLMRPEPHDEVEFLDRAFLR